MPDITIKTLQPGDEAALEAFLLPRLSTSMFLIGNTRISGLAYNGKRYTGTYCAAYEDDEIVGVVAHFWNGNIIVQAPAHLDELWRATLAASGRPLEGMLGPDDQINAIKAALDPDPANLQLDQTEQLYALDLNALIVPEALRTGAVHGRRATPRDLDILTEWRIGFLVEAIGNEDSSDLHAHARDAMSNSIKEGNIWILEVEGQPVATAAFNTQIAEAVQLGNVYTPPNMRRQGYARCAVAQSLLDARDTGVTQAILFTGADNHAAQKAYTALGFQLIGDYRLLFFREAMRIETMNAESKL